MRLLDRYLLRELSVPLAYCVSGFLIFWISFDLFGELEEFQTLRMRGGDVARYYVARLPDLLVLILPVALLLALLYALTHHARHQELTAMRAAGISLWRLSLPYLALGFLFSILMFWMNEYVAPDAADLAEQIKARRSAAASALIQRDWRQKVNFHNDRAGRDWIILAYNLATFEMKKPRLDWWNPDGTGRTIIADTARWTNQSWTFFKVTDTRFDTNQNTVVTNFPALTLPELNETPELIRSEIKVSGLTSIRAAKGAQLSLRELRDFFQLHPQLAPKPAALLRTQFQARLAAPWTCLVVVLIAIPFGVPSGRRNIFVGVASSIFICFSYFLLQRFGLALGTGGYLPPWLAAWFPNLFFGALGVVLISRAR